MKKLLSIILMMALALSLFACGSDKCDKCADKDADGKCDKCGSAVVCTECVDEDADKKCDVCGKAVVCAECVDKDGDEKCDVCGTSVDVAITNAARIDSIIKMYNAILPSKVVTTSRATFGEYDFSPITSTLIMGTVDGSSVSVYEKTEVSLREIPDGAGIEIVKPFTDPKTVKMEYHEKLGLRIDGGKWDITGADFTPTLGANVYNFTKDNVSDMTENKDLRTYTFTVKADKTEEVFGEDIGVDVTVVISHSSADISSIEISYTTESKNSDHPEMNFYLKAEYSYETQEITLN